MVSFSPTYGSTELYVTDNTITFSFNDMTVYPSRMADNTTLGQIVIYRGAVKADGTIFKTNLVLWENLALDDFKTPNPL